MPANRRALIELYAKCCPASRGSEKEHVSALMVFFSQPGNRGWLATSMTLLHDKLVFETHAEGRLLGKPGQNTTFNTASRYSENDIRTKLLEKLIKLEDLCAKEGITFREGNVFPFKPQT